MSQTAAAVARGGNGDSQRTRILASALELMAQSGADAVTMRQLAAACGLNAATLYHYFPSKADLLHAVIADRSYLELLDVGVPVDPTLPPRPRLAALLTSIWQGALAEEDVWRLIVGESLRSRDAALTVVAELTGALEVAIRRWLDEHFPEVDRPTEVAAALTGEIFGFFIEVMVVPRRDPATYLAARADAIAAVVFPDPS